MSELLNMYFVRSTKMKIFWFGLGFCVLFAVLSVLTSFEDSLSNVCPQILVTLPFVIAAVVGLVVSAEFSHGTIRNKIIVGHSKRSIYTALLISVSAITLFYFVTFVIVSFVFGAFMGDISEISAKATTVTLLLSVLLLLNSAALSLFICMTIHGNKSIVLTLLLQYALLFLYVMGTELENRKVRNLIMFITNFIAQCQVDNLNFYFMPDKPWLTAICTTVGGAAITLLGIKIFEKSDLK